ncbi:MAG: hypothetical protein JWM44_1982 [Bacilli bacterium]|nr:hypothetical protein [Bacilli bacterium]
MDCRDQRGRFAPGNQLSVGNKGNRRPKWRNQNAVKHGFYARAWLDIFTIDADGWLNIRIIGGKFIGIRVHPDAFEKGADGIYLREDIVDVVERARNDPIDETERSE